MDIGGRGTVRLCETAHAKINLALHVRRRRADGYHDLETLFAFAEDGDILHAEPAKALSLTIEGPFAPALAKDAPADNLVFRAAHAMQDTFGVSAGAALTLDKRLPVASGIGGGSADAAAAIRLLARLWGVAGDDPRLGVIAATLGADVPACLRSIATRGDVRGDRLTEVDSGALTGRPLLLVNPGVAVSTAAVFARWDGVDRGALLSGNPMTIAEGGRNDLEAPARLLVPVIDTLIARLREAPGAILSRMSGSGATCFALFETSDARDAAAASVRRDTPDYWTLATGLR